MARTDAEQRVVGRHPRHQSRRRVGAWVGRVQTLGVGEQHQQVGRQVVGHQRGDAVVVAVADLVAGDRVVLVDDRDAPQLEQPDEGLSCVQVLAPVDEVVRHEQHLGGHRAPCDRGERLYTSISRLCPAADKACSVGMSAGRAGRPSAATPADTAPELTTTTSWPSERTCTSCSHSDSMTASSMMPSSSVSDEVPIFTMMRIDSAVRLVLEAEPGDPDDVAIHRARA